MSQFSAPGVVGNQNEGLRDRDGVISNSPEYNSEGSRETEISLECKTALTSKFGILVMDWSWYHGQGHGVMAMCKKYQEVSRITVSSSSEVAKTD